MSENTIMWPGKSGSKYKYWIHQIGTSFKAESGNYIYAKESSPGKWVAVYIGETGDLSDRTLEGHHKEDCIRRNGATHVHAHASSASADIRRAEEADLVEKWNPTCNG